MRGYDRLPPTGQTSRRAVARRQQTTEALLDGVTRLARGAGLQLYNVMNKPYSAVGDGVTDDWQAIKDAALDAYNAGGGVVYLPPRTFALSDIIPLCGNVTLFGPGATLLRAGSGTTNWIWSNLWQHHSQQKNRILSCIPYAVNSTTYTIDTPTQYDDQVVTSTASEAGNFTDGDWVYIEWGTANSDSAEQFYAGVNRVRGNPNATTGVIPLEVPLPANTTYTTLPGSASPRIRIITGPWTGSIIGPLTFYGDTSPGTVGEAIVVTMSFGGRVRDVRIKDGRAGLSVYDSHNVVIDGIVRDRHPQRDSETNVVKHLVSGWCNSNLVIANFTDFTWGWSGSVGFETTTWGASIGPGVVMHHQPDTTEQKPAITWPTTEPDGIEHVDVHDVVVRNAYDGIQGSDSPTFQVRDCVIAVSNKPFIGNLYPRHVSGCTYEVIGSEEPVHQTTREKFRFSGTVTSGGGPVTLTAETADAQNNPTYANHYYLGRAANVVAVTIYTDAAITSGSITTRLLVNGSTQTNLPTLDSSNTPAYHEERQYSIGTQNMWMSAGEHVGVQFVSFSHAPSPMDVWVELEVEY